MNEALNEKYREILISPIRECATYSPKFGHGRGKGLSLNDFQALYGADSFYKWLGLDNPLMYSAHKAAGGITSIYRQIGIGSERLVREILMDNLGLDEKGVKWSYQVPAPNGKVRTLSLDARIIFMVMSSQIDDDIVTRYSQSKWLILEGHLNSTEYISTFDFFKNIIGFDFADFLSSNQCFFKSETQKILEELMRAK